MALTVGEIIDNYYTNKLTDRVYVTFHGLILMTGAITIKKIKKEESEIIELPKNIRDIQVESFRIDTVYNMRFDYENLKWFDFPINLIDFVMDISKEDYKIVEDWASSSGSDTSD